jgi:hypothetical protein
MVGSEEKRLHFRKFVNPWAVGLSLDASKIRRTV